MKTHLKTDRMTRSLFLLLSLCLGLSMNIQAQGQPYAVTPQLGVVFPILDEGTGFHVGINPTARLLSWLSAEGQLSFRTTRITGEFLSGKPRIPKSLNAAQAMGGLRLYMNRERNKYRPFLNVLLGLGYIQETGLESSIDGAATYGIFVQGPHLMGGLSIETQGALLFKLGYTIPVGNGSRREDIPGDGS